MHERFLRDELDVVVATVAFGMGAPALGMVLLWVFWLSSACMLCFYWHTVTEMPTTIAYWCRRFCADSCA